MKTKKLFLYVLFIGFISLVFSTSCQKEEDSPDSTACEGYVKLETSGFINSNYCFDRLVSYDYTAHDNAKLWVGQNSSTTYSFDFSVIDNGNFQGVGTYDCGKDKPGYVEFIIHGDGGDFYKSSSGTLTLTKVDEDNVKGSFDVVAKGYDNNETVNLKGTFEYGN